MTPPTGIGISSRAVDYVTSRVSGGVLAHPATTAVEPALQKDLLPGTRSGQKNADGCYRHLGHRLKTPLAAAAAAFRSLQFKSEIVRRTRHLAQQAQNALAMTGEVVDALLLLSTVAQQQVELKPLDTGSLVRQALSQLGEMLARQRADVKLPQTWPQALGYAPWVGEVWLNLLSNARKYGCSPRRLEVAGAPDGPHVRLQWCETKGQPLSKDERRPFLQPFTRLHKASRRPWPWPRQRCSASCRSSGGTVGVTVGSNEGNYFLLYVAGDGGARAAGLNSGLRIAFEAKRES